jgi:MFS transporter, DHA2 family, multidrug resistance protein
MRYGRARQWAVLFALGLAALVVGLDMMVLVVALPTLSRDLGASTSDLQWITDAYTLSLAAFLMPVGLLADRFGRRTVLLAGLVVFGLASAVCAEVGTPGQLVAARVALGLGAAVLISVPLSILPTVFGAAGRGRAMSILVATMMLGLPAGPILGGYLLRHFWWGSVFLINVPAAVLALVMVAFLVPQSRRDGARRPDVPGVALSAAGITALVYGVIEGPERGWASPPVLGSLAGAVLLLVAFVLTEARGRSPLISLSLFADRRFSVGVVSITLAGFALFGVVFVVPQYLQAVRGEDALGSGIRLLPMIAGIVLGAPLSDRLVGRLGRRIPVAGGLLVAGAGLALHATLTVHSGYGLTAAAMAIEGFGIGLALAPSMDCALSAFGSDDASTGSSLVQSIRQVGGSLSIAVMGSVLNAAYRHQLDPALRGLTPSAADAARGSVSGAAKIAGGLGPAGAPLRAAADAAFVHGMSVMLAACAAVAATGAVLAATLLPNRAARQPAPSDEHPVPVEVTMDP